jgi:acetyl esterase/lipase
MKTLTVLALAIAVVFHPLRAQEKTAVEKVTALAAVMAETTPVTIAGAESFIYRDGKPEPMRLFVCKPEGWKVDVKRPALVWFFGGGWTKGTPEKSVGWARLAATWGLVGVAPD